MFIREYGGLLTASRFKGRLGAGLGLAKCVVLLGVVLIQMVAGTNASAQELQDPRHRPARQITADARVAMLDIIRAGDRLVAVGERGIILVSTNSGKDWVQATVPVAVTLTAVRFVDSRKGWAVGHSGVILHTDDGGANWTVQLDGIRAAELIAEQANVADGPDASEQQNLAKLFVEDGADKPFLALEFENEKTGLVVGAYGMAFRTEDGGATWVPWLTRVANPEGMHFYAMYRDGTTWTLAGEQGLFVRSVDAGQHFVAVKTPYRGSYFTLSSTEPGKIILGGLRGHAFRYNEIDGTFKALQVPIPVTLASSATLQDGSQVFINQAGQWLALRGDALLPVQAPDGAPANAVAVAPDGTLWAATWRGLVRFSVPHGHGAEPAKEVVEK